MQDLSHQPHMETVEVHAKAFLIHWKEVPEGTTVRWQVRPLKKSVCFGIYHQANPEKPNDLKEGNLPLADRLASQGFEVVQELEKLSGNETETGDFEATAGGMYAFVFDNMFSKSTAKTIEFAVAHGSEPEGHRGSVVESIADAGLQSSPDGRYIRGPMLKKRRKKMQGYARRFFSLDTRLGQFHYYLNAKSSHLRGVMPIRICEITPNKSTREITLDSGMEQWSLKALNSSDFEAWVNALETASHPTLAHVVNRQNAAGGHSRQLSTVATLKAPSPESDENKVDLDALAPLIRRLHSSVQSNSDLQTKNMQNLVRDFDRLLSAKGHSKKPSRFKKARQKITQQTKQVPFWLLVALGSVFIGSITGFLMTIARNYKFYVTAVIALVSGTWSYVAHFIYEKNRVTEVPVDESDYEYSSDESDQESIAPTPSVEVPSSADHQHHDEQHHASLAAAAAAAALYGPHKAAGHESPLKGTSHDEEPVQQAEVKLPPLPHAAVKRRSTVPKCTHSPPSLISMIRKSAGKDLSSISAPVTSNEPISLLQRLAEQLEYSELLDKAAAGTGEDRLLYTALFAVSGLASVRVKDRALRKPFNSLLGESYELVREDKQFRFVSEKVSHRPPVLASQAESAHWTFHWTSRPHQKIWGASAEITDSGPMIVQFRDGEIIHFIGPDCFLRNLLAGEKYIEPVGTLHIESSSGETAEVTFKEGGMFSGRSEEITVSIGGKVAAKGSWVKEISNSKGKTVWTAGALLDDPKHHYGWSGFTASLNEITEIEEGYLPPNDSRLRPDQRAYESVKIDEAEQLKQDLEQRQRERRKDFEDEGKPQEPVFFENSGHELGYFQLKTGERNYWGLREQKDWSSVPKYLDPKNK